MRVVFTRRGNRGIIRGEHPRVATLRMRAMRVKSVRIIKTQSRVQRRMGSVVIMDGTTLVQRIRTLMQHRLTMRVVFMRRGNLAIIR